MKHTLALLTALLLAPLGALHAVGVPKPTGKPNTSSSDPYAIHA